MLRAAHRSSSGALNCICSLWFLYPCGDRLLSRRSGKCGNFPLGLDNSRSSHGYINQRLQIKFRAPDDQWCAAQNMLSLSINFGLINSITRCILLVLLLSQGVFDCILPTYFVILYNTMGMSHLKVHYLVPILSFIHPAHVLPSH